MFNKFSSHLTLIAFGSILGVFNSQTPATAAFFTGVGDLPGGGFSSAATSVSADGSIVGGISFSEAGPDGEAFLWTAETGLMGLGDLPGGDFLSGVFGVSDDGLAAAGASFSAESALSMPPLQSFHWTAETGLVPLGDLPGGTFSSFTLSISGDGRVVVGDSDSASGREAFRWSAETGMVGLGDFEGGDFDSTVVSASFDGSVIVGTGTNSIGKMALRWTEEAGLSELGDLPGGEIFSTAASVSNDGLVVAGRSSSANSSASGLPVTLASGTEAFRWTAEMGMIGLGDLAGGNFFSTATAISGDGSIIVGQSEGAFGEEPFIWDSLNGMRSLTEVLTNDFDLELGSWTNLTATEISSDGSTIVGLGLNPDGNLEGWIAGLDSQPVPVPEPRSTGGTLVLLGLIGMRLFKPRFQEQKIKTIS